MDRPFWSTRWAEQKIAFHIDEVNPALLTYWTPHFGPAAGQRVLLPLCGKSVDLRWLADLGHEVVGVEFVEQAVETFFQEQSLKADMSPTDHGTCFRAERPPGPSIELWCADFFQLSARQTGLFPLAYDRAALIAVQPEKRPAYVSQMHDLLQPGARVLLLTLEHDIPSGPPFSIQPTEVSALLRDRFALERLGERDVLKHEPRFRDRGASFMLETAWRLRRL